MKLAKKFFLIGALISISAMLFAQAQSVQKKSSNNETYVENEYLNDIDSEIISGLAESDDLDNKLLALIYIRDAIDEGNTSQGVIEALDKLSGEGVLSESRTNGRKVNNFPQVRKDACILMAKVPTEHSKNQLISIGISDNEPMVSAAAVQSLGIIANADNTDDVIAAVHWINRKYLALNPTSSLAFEVVDAYEKLAPNASKNALKLITESLTNIAGESRLSKSVQQRAQKLLKKLANSNSSKNSSDAK